MTKTLDSDVASAIELILASPEQYEMGPAVDHIRYGDKFVQEYDTEELRAAYIEHLGACRCCGQLGSSHAASVDRDFLVNVWTIDRRFQVERPKMNASLDNIARSGCCEKCCDLSEASSKAMKRQAGMQRLRKKLFTRNILPREFPKAQFIDSDENIMLRNPKVWEDARSWNPKHEAWWIYGDKGAGKTFMARCVLNMILDQGFSVGELSAVTFNQIAKRRFYEWHEEREIYGKVKVLLIEDIDKAIWTPEGMSELYSLLDERYSNERRTMVTTNATVEWVQQQWQYAAPHNKSLPGTMMDRLKPMRRIQLSGPTLRKGGANEFT
ncbi:hypothetical protein LCGC14_1137800 [marine sediment metagenome]|uniref:ATPase AAA-type core domain-containing protein n=1 Tax=marine sediment metagenome TaxID=412755 RepID=A0A0F9PHE5_9ZZZZ